MGIQWFAATTKMMKSILFAALVAAAYADAEPKADADAYYGYYGYARPYAYGYARPYAYGYGLGGFRYLGKRSADADADADAYYGYYGYARPYAYGYSGYLGAYGYGLGGYRYL